jgi:hypothetical protein
MTDISCAPGQRTPKDRIKLRERPPAYSTEPRGLRSGQTICSARRSRKTRPRSYRSPSISRTPAGYRISNHLHFSASFGSGEVRVVFPQGRQGNAMNEINDAERVATILAYEFLREGRYSAASGPIEVHPLATAVAVSTPDRKDIQSSFPEGFEGLAVQSVGFEAGPKEPKVHIYLTRASAKLIKSLPSQLEGVPILAHRMGNIVVRPEAASSATNHGHLFERGNRICCGSSCAPTSENCSGTLGAIVRRSGEANLYLLSNNHVLAGCNHVPKDQPILSPSSADGRPTMRAPAEIGRHSIIHELRSGSPNFVNPCDADLALARATDASAISSWQGGLVDGYDTPGAAAAPLSLMRVKKFGRTTALTEGMVEAKVTTPMPVSYNAKHFKGTVWFKDVWTVHGLNGVFALPGDSGSLVVTQDGTKAVGLVFAASTNGEYAWIIPMPCIVGALGGLELVAEHGV